MTDEQKAAMRLEFERIIGYCGHCMNGVEVEADANGDPSPVCPCPCTKHYDALLALFEQGCIEARDRGVLLGQAMAHEGYMWPEGLLENGSGECLLDEKPFPKKYASNLTHEAKVRRDKVMQQLGDITPEERDWKINHRKRS